MLRFDESGRGDPPAVFVHAIGRGGAAAWPSQHVDLGRRARFLYRAGFHPEDALPASVTFGAETEALLASLGADAAQVVAHSWAGLVALLAALRAPERVRSLVLIEPIAVTAARYEPAVLAHMAALAPAYDPALSLEQFHEAFARGMGFAPTPQPWSEAQQRSFALLRLHPPPWEAPLAPDDFAHLEVPTLVVTSGADLLYEVIAEALAALTSAVDHRHFRGLGHRPQDAESFNDLLRTWWSEVEQPPPPPPPRA